MDKQDFEYRTGQTKPSKSIRGLIAFLLICVIFLGGLVSLLGVMNIHLLSKLQDTSHHAPLSFAQGDAAPAIEDSPSLTVEGFVFQELPTVYQQMYDLPAGLYVVDAPHNSPVKEGDVLISFNGTPVPTLSLLDSLYTSRPQGAEMILTFHREGATFTHTIE